MIYTEASTGHIVAAIAVAVIEDQKEMREGIAFPDQPYRRIRVDFRIHAHSRRGHQADDAIRNESRTDEIDVQDVWDDLVPYKSAGKAPRTNKG